MKKHDLPFDGEDDALSAALATTLLPRAKAPPQLLRERILGTISRPRLRYAPFYGALRDLFDLNDSQLSDVFERAANPEAWTPAPIPSTFLLHFEAGPRVAYADNGLVRITAGAAFPRHRHLGLERALVLQGGYRDEPSGRTFRAGDSHEMAADTTHTYVALPGIDLLVAVSLRGGIELQDHHPLTPGE